MPSTSDITSIINKFQVSIEENISTWAQNRTPSGFRDAEMEVMDRCRYLADQIMVLILCQILRNATFNADVTMALRKSKIQMQHGGYKSTKVRLLGGSEVHLDKILYMKPKKKKGPGRKRGSGKRGKGAEAFFPLLAALGIFNKCTPALTEEIVHQVSSSESVRSARDALARRNIDFGHKETLDIFNKVSKGIVKQRNEELERILKTQKPITGVLAGKRVVVATDGGRIRIRTNKKGRKTKSGRRRFEAEWKEPKVITIYTIDADGKQDTGFSPLYDGTMGDADKVFDMLGGYLLALGGAQAEEVIFLGDGAKWIWNRVDSLSEMVGIAKERVTQVVDWYHAVETLWEIVRVRSTWSKKQHQKWIKKAKGLLSVGEITELLAMIQALCRGRKSKEISKHIDYFRRNTHRMQYSSCEKRKIPKGSGAIESAVRRIVNMRLKGNAKYWLRENAEGMLLMRSYLKSGRLENLLLSSREEKNKWWMTHLYPMEIPSLFKGVY